MFGFESWCSEDGLLLFDVLDNFGGLLFGVAEFGQRPRNGLVDDEHRPAPDQLLGLGERQVGFDAGRVAIHHQTDRARRREDAGLRIPHAVGLTDVDRFVPCPLRGAHELGRNDVFVDLGGSGAVHPEDVEHRVAVLRVPGERAHPPRGSRARRVRMAGHERSDRGGPGAPIVGVVRQALGHEERAEVRVAQAELAEPPTVLGDLVGRVVGVADEDLLGGEHDFDGVLEPFDVEGPVVLQILEEVDAREVAGGVVDVHVLRARVAGVDAAAVWGGVPPVDRRVVLHSRVGAFPCRVGDLAHEVSSFQRPQWLAALDFLERPVAVFLDGVHEVIGDPHRVVRVLVLDRMRVDPVKVHVEAGVAERSRFALFAGLTPDELLDVGVVDVEDDHLGGPPSLPA